MKCEIVAVGTELLLGNIANTNAQYLSQKLAELGIDVYYHTVVGDNLERAADTISACLRRSDIVITTGGLGPTDDDLTREAVAKALELELVRHEPSLNKITGYFRNMGRPMPECNAKQADILEGAIVLENDNGTAPGQIAEKQGKIVILLPGPPKELIPMFEKSVYGYIKNKSGYTILSRTLKVIGVGESSIQEALKDIFDTQSNPTIAPYAKEGEVHLRITAKCESVEEAGRLINGMERQVRTILKENIYGCDSDTLESVIFKMLKEHNLKIATAESCTGGLVSSRLTEIPGVSECFMNGITTYSNEAKMNFLKVSGDTLDKYGAVSEETALEMVKGIRTVSNTEVGISVTGIAGPDGGTPEKPVGLVYVAVSCLDKTGVLKLNLTGNRQKIRWNASTRVLDLLRRMMIERYNS